MALPESPRSTPETPTNKLLTQFRSTLDKRWAEFDAATLREAGGVEVARNLHPDFQKAKASFDAAKGVLTTITTDKELRTQLNAPGVLSATIQDLESYFSALNAQDKQKEYNKVLASTIADLTSLKAQMTESFDDKRRAEAARASANSPVGGNPPPANPLDSLEAGIPTVAATVSGLGAAAASTGIVSEGWFKTKVKGWVVDFENWITGLLPDGPMKTRITGFFTLLKTKLGINIGANNNGIPELNDVEKTHGVRGAKKVFELLVKNGTIKESEKGLQEYFTHEKILKRSMKDLRGLMKEHENNKGALALALGFEESQGEKVYAAIGIMLSPKARIEMKSVGIKDAEELPVGRLFSSAAKYADMLDRIRTKGKDLDVSDLSFSDGFSRESIGEFMGEKKEMLLALRERFKGFTPRVLMILHSGYSVITVSDNQKFEAHIKELNPEEQEFLQKTLPEYTKRLPILLQSLAFGSEKNTKVIDSYLKSPGLNYADAIDLFVLSGGNTDITNMNSFEKAQVVIRTFLMLRKAKVSDGYLYGAELAKAVLDDSKQMNIPPEVKIILKDVTGLLTEVLKKSAEEAAGIAAGIARSSPFFTAGAGALALGALMLAIKLTPVGRVATTFIWILSATGILAAIGMAYKFTDDGKIIDAKTGEVKADVEKLADEYRKSQPKA